MPPIAHEIPMRMAAYLPHINRLLLIIVCAMQARVPIGKVHYYNVLTKLKTAQARSKKDRYSCNQIGEG